MPLKLGQGGFPFRTVETYEALFVGDNVNEDIEGAARVGIKSILIQHPEEEKGEYRKIPGMENLKSHGEVIQPNYVIHDLKKLLEILEEEKANSAI